MIEDFKLKLKSKSLSGKTGRICSKTINDWINIIGTVLKKLYDFKKRYE